MNKSWSKIAPTTPGAYWVRGFNNFGEGEQYEALVEVITKDGNLMCNLHETNSDPQYDFLEHYPARFEWCGPLVPLGQGWYPINQGWFPIATAPKDGRTILAYGTSPCLVSWDPNLEAWLDQTLLCRDPFCWTPIAVPLKGEVVEVAQ